MKSLEKKSFASKKKKKASPNSIPFESSQMRREPINDSFCVHQSIFINPSDISDLSGG